MRPIKRTFYTMGYALHEFNDKVVLTITHVLHTQAFEILILKVNN